MSEEYIEEGINGQWTDWKFEAENYKKIYEHLYQEKQQLKQALLDIKEYIETNSYFKDNIVKTMVLGDYSKGILDIVNKVLGSDSNE